MSMLRLTMSENGIKFLMEFEGFEKKVHHDTCGFSTIGIGHVLTKSEHSSGKILINNDFIQYRGGLNDQQIMDLLKQDLVIFENVVRESVKIHPNQNMFDALVSFAFCVGVTAFKNSTMLKLLNEGDYNGVFKQFRRWIYSNGKIINRLINKRRAEIELFRKF